MCSFLVYLQVLVGVALFTNLILTLFCGRQKKGDLLEWKGPGSRWLSWLREHDPNFFAEFGPGMTFISSTIFYTFRSLTTKLSKKRPCSSILRIVFPKVALEQRRNILFRMPKTQRTKRVGQNSWTDHSHDVLKIDETMITRIWNAIGWGGHLSHFKFLFPGKTSFETLRLLTTKKKWRKKGVDNWAQPQESFEDSGRSEHSVWLKHENLDPWTG